MADQCHTINAWMRPLSLGWLDPIVAAASRQEEVRLDLSAFLRNLLHHSRGDLAKQIIERRQGIDRFDEMMLIVPADALILQKVVWPLRSAKQSYVLAEYLACIALAGTVGEMVATLVFEMAHLNPKGQPLDRAAQKRLFGRPFEELGQYRRADVLEALGLWTTDQVSKATELRKIRNEYLHRLSSDQTRVEGKALTAYRLALELAASTVNLPVGDGGIAVPSESLLRHIRQQEDREC